MSGTAETIKRIEELMVLDKIEAWAAAKKPTEYVGHRKRSDSCPLYSYLKESGLPVYAVGEGSTILHLDGWEDAVRWPMPADLYQVVRRVDDSSTYGTRIQARTFLRLVREVAADAARV